MCVLIYLHTFKCSAFLSTMHITHTHTHIYILDIYVFYLCTHTSVDVSYPVQPSGSSTVLSVPGHCEQVFSVSLAFSSRRTPWYDCTIKSWLWLISAFGISFSWTGSLAWATTSSRPHSDVFDCNDTFKASCSRLASQQGCILSWRGRQHRVDVIPSSVENSWDSKTNSWSFHPTSFDPFWKGWLFPLSFQLSEQKSWALWQQGPAPLHCTPLWVPDGAERKPSTSARWSRSQWLLLLMAHVWLYLLNLVKQETGFEARGSWRVQAPDFKCSYKMHNWHQLTGNI